MLYVEVEAAMYKLKPNKSAGTDEITAEMLQMRAEHMKRRIYELCSRTWKGETIPEEWDRLILIPIPKNGDLRECSNY